MVLDRYKNNLKDKFEHFSKQNKVFDLEIISCPKINLFEPTRRTLEIQNCIINNKKVTCVWTNDMFVYGEDNQNWFIKKPYGDCILWHHIVYVQKHENSILLELHDMKTIYIKLHGDNVEKLYKLTKHLWYHSTHDMSLYTMCFNGSETRVVSENDVWNMYKYIPKDVNELATLNVLCKKDKTLLDQLKFIRNRISTIVRKELEYNGSI